MDFIQRCCRHNYLRRQILFFKLLEGKYPTSQRRLFLLANGVTATDAGNLLLEEVDREDRIKEVRRVEIYEWIICTAKYININWRIDYANIWIISSGNNTSPSVTTGICTIAIKLGPGVNLVKKPNSRFYGSIQINSCQLGLTRKN